MRKILTFFICISCFPLMAGVAIIVHPSNPTSSLDAETASKIFMGKSSKFPDGSKAVPLDLPESSQVRADFSEKVLGKSVSKLKSYWSKMVFTGKATPPKETSDENEMIRLIKDNPNMVGYVDSSKVTSDVKVVLTIE